jgi:hypothetical protein
MRAKCAENEKPFVCISLIAKTDSPIENTDRIRPDCERLRQLDAPTFRVGNAFDGTLSLPFAYRHGRGLLPNSRLRQVPEVESRA